MEVAGRQGKSVESRQAQPKAPAGHCSRLAKCDTSSAEEAAAVLKPAKALPELQGLLNCGGVLADAVLSSQTAGTCPLPLPSGAAEYQKRDHS